MPKPGKPGMILVKREELRSQKGTITTGSMGKRATRIVGLGAVIAFLILLGLFLAFASEAQKLDPVSLNVEVIPADTCSLVYDMRGFSGDTLLEYMAYLDSHTSGDGLFFLFSPQLLVMYHVEFKPRKGCLSDLLDQAVSGTDLTWDCKGANILIFRK